MEQEVFGVTSSRRPFAENVMMMARNIFYVDLLISLVNEQATHFFVDAV